MLHLIKRFYQRLSRSLAYFNQGWNSQDWDYHYLLDDIAFKLDRMEKCFKESKYVVHHPKMFRRIKEIRDLCRYYDKGSTSVMEAFETRPEESLLDFDIKVPRLNLGFQQDANRLDRLFLLMRKHIERFWD